MIWLDALTANVDRSWRNPNLLVWHKELWAIDHGACLYFHHAWSGGVTDPDRFARQPWDASDHVLGRRMRVIVVGGGILGLAAARLAAVEHPQADVLVLEKERAVAQHQTGRNSGVVHAGLYYEPGSLKAMWPSEPTPEETKVKPLALV